MAKMARIIRDLDIPEIEGAIVPIHQRHPPEPDFNDPGGIYVRVADLPLIARNIIGKPEATRHYFHPPRLEDDVMNSHLYEEVETSVCSQCDSVFIGEDYLCEGCRDGA